jgi:XTP/dITP diphosphohydrolase
MDFLLASNNEHKRIELEQLLTPHALGLPSSRNIDFEFEETGATFIENSIGKAMHLYQLAHAPTISDDSGLVIDALDGEPGIYSNRYGSELYNRLLSDSERNAYVLEKLRDVPPAQRQARFVCAMTIVLDHYRIYTIQESVEGEIALYPSGSGGFGYDPIFRVHSLQKMMAELTTKEKNRVSHRALAAQRILTLLENITP